MENLMHAPLDWETDFLENAWFTEDWELPPNYEHPLRIPPHPQA